MRTVTYTVSFDECIGSPLVLYYLPMKLEIVLPILVPMSSINKRNVYAIVHSRLYRNER